MHLSWSERLGGAAIAASRLNNALNDFGVQSWMMSTSGLVDPNGVLRPSSNAGRLIDRLSARVDQLPLRGRKAAGPLFSPALAPERTAMRLRRQKFDIAHLHWITNGFLKIDHFARIGRPLVWTLHDMWPFTGGCHYSGGCTGYEAECGSCPQLGSGPSDDLSHRVLARKAKAWADLKMMIVTPSRWLADQARSSRLFSRLPVEVIPYCLDLTAFAPRDRIASRSRFGLPTDATILLFGALTGDGDRRKGLHLMMPALQELVSLAPGRRFHLALFGVNAPAQPIKMPLPVSYLGVLSNQDDIAQAYAAADVFVAPSLEDNLPNTVIEAASCALPSVAFRIGGMPDLIAHRESGYLASPFDPRDLAAGIIWIVEDESRYRAVAAAARDHVERHYSPRIIAERYARLYARILGPGA
jgi:glycosyltransferase involved in cell wall biosynthesis